MDTTPIDTIDAYIAAQPEAIQPKLHELRAIIKAAAPDATEKISYAMPTFYLKGNLVYFGAFKSHIGFYPMPSGIDAFPDEIAPYKGTMSSLHIKFDQPIPADLITRIVQFRISENLQWAETKAAKKKSN